MAAPGNVEKLCILDGGLARVEDASLYAPGIDVGPPRVLRCDAYPIRHRDRWLLWDSGPPLPMRSSPSPKAASSPTASAPSSCARWQSS